MPRCQIFRVLDIKVGRGDMTMVRQEQMAGQQRSDELLDTLTVRLGCNYLSDLKSPQHKAGIAGVLATITAESYPLAQWNEALAYLCGQAPCADVESARRMLLQCAAQL